MNPLKSGFFPYPDIKGDPVETQHKALTAYLFDAKGVINRHLVVKEESGPVNEARKIKIGSKPIDGGYLIFDATERAALLAAEPQANQFVKPYIGGQDFINGGNRWIATLQNAAPDVLRGLPRLMERVAKVRQYRNGEIAPKGKPQKKKPGQSSLSLAATPTAFHVTVIPESAFLAIPEVSSERRDYIPLGWLEPPIVPSNKLRLLPEASLWEFGVLTSRSHMAWSAHIGGRLKSDFQYGIGLNYNTFPWPDGSAAKRTKIEALAQAVLDARAAHPTSSLADLYDPDTMPADLRRAHNALDKAVDRLYRAAPFETDRDRVEHLFGRYEALVNPLERLGAAKNKRVSRKAKAKGKGKGKGKG